MDLQSSRTHSLDMRAICGEKERLMSRLTTLDMRCIHEKRCFFQRATNSHWDAGTTSSNDAQAGTTGPLQRNGSLTKLPSATNLTVEPKQKGAIFRGPLLRNLLRDGSSHTPPPAATPSSTHSHRHPNRTPRCCSLSGA